MYYYLGTNIIFPIVLEQILGISREIRLELEIKSEK